MCGILKEREVYLQLVELRQFMTDIMDDPLAVLALLAVLYSPLSDQ
jgi:hypothetical protein